MDMIFLKKPKYRTHHFQYESKFRLSAYNKGCEKKPQQHENGSR